MLKTYTVIAAIVAVALSAYLAFELYAKKAPAVTDSGAKQSVSSQSNPNAVSNESLKQSVTIKGSDKLEQSVKIK